jgi:hypothetical protein
MYAVMQSASAVLPNFDIKTPVYVNQDQWRKKQQLMLLPSGQVSLHIW